MVQFQTEVSAMPASSTTISATGRKPRPERLGQEQEDDQRDEGREHEHVAVGEVDHADDAEHHRIADGDEAIDRAQRQPVDELLNEIVHAALQPPPGLETLVVALRQARNAPTSAFPGARRPPPCCRRPRGRRRTHSDTSGIGAFLGFVKRTRGRLSAPLRVGYVASHAKTPAFARVHATAGNARPRR